MKKVLKIKSLYVGILLMLFISCKEKCPKIEATANINDILGTWISADSMVVVRPNSLEYAQELLFIEKDSLLRNSEYSIYVKRSFNLTPDSTGGFAYYLGKYYGLDSLVLRYNGPTLRMTPLYRYKLYFDATKDTMRIIDFKATYPSLPFNLFYKKRK